MTIEQKLQDYILDKYKSVMQFAKLVDLINGEIKEQIHIDKLSDHEKKVILAYRNKVDMQPAVDRLLGVEDEILIPTVKAARSDGNNQPIEIVNLPDLSKFEPDDTDL